jgi:uncharacterized OB-fold protein
MKQRVESKAPLVWPGEIPIQSFYTAGSGGQIFFNALKQDGKLIGTRCAPCAQVYVPARSFCERCFSALTETVEVKHTGRLVSYTVCYFDRDRQPLDRPLALALVRLDGATTLLLHHLLGVDAPDSLEIGNKVETIIKPRTKRVGSILDIEGFRIV